MKTIKKYLGYIKEVTVNENVSLYSEFTEGGNKKITVDSFGNKALYISRQTGYEFVKMLKGTKLIPLENTDTIINYINLPYEQTI